VQNTAEKHTRCRNRYRKSHQHGTKSVKMSKQASRLQTENEKKQYYSTIIVCKYCFKMHSERLRKPT